MSVKKKMKPNLKAQMSEHEVPEHKGKWRNFWMFPCGISRIGDGLYPTKQAAAAQAASNKETMGVIGLTVQLRTGEGTVKIESYLAATVIQIPVKE